MITLHYFPRTRAFRGLWLMEESGLPYTLALTDFRAGATAAPAFRAVNPMGKLPALEDGPVRMGESAAIALYVADRYPEAGLGVAIDHPDRGRFLQWLLFTPVVIEGAMTERFNKLEPRPQQYGWGSFDRMLEVLEGGLTNGPWLLGDKFTAADVLVADAVGFMAEIGMSTPSPALADYHARATARPAWQRAHAIEAREAAAHPPA